MATGMIALLGVAVLFIGWIVGLVADEIRFLALILLMVGVIFILVAVVLDYRRVGRALVSRRGRFGTGTTLMVSVFIGIILLANAISTGNFHRFDTTGLAQYTLTSQTKEVLANLDQDVEIIKFFVPDDATGGASYATSLLDEYENFTARLDIKVVDPDEHPEQARDHGITEYQRSFFATYGVASQTVVFVGDSGERIVGLEAILTEAEHVFTSAILEVTGTVQTQVYFISGHGEVDIYDASPRGYALVREGLKDNLFKTTDLDLLQMDAVPDDADVLVLAAPSPDIPLTDREMELIMGYLIGGGRMLVLVNPSRPDEINQMLALWGVVVNKYPLIDPTSYTAPNIDTPSVDRTRNAFGVATTYFPGVTEIIPTGAAVKYAETQPLLWTSDDAYVDEDYDPNVPSQYNEETDAKGARVIGVMIAMIPPQPEDPDEPVTIPDDYVDTRLIVIGDSDFATNQHFFNGGNGDLFLTSISWLTSGGELISIDRKFLQTRRLILRPEAKLFIDISSIALLPLAVFIVGGIIWYRRR